MDVVDLHCDLLAYLAKDPTRGPLDPAPRCSALQQRGGNVTLQTYAIFSETAPHSLSYGLKQLDLFLSLPHQYPTFFNSQNSLVAFENGSTFCLEKEPIEDVFKRLELILAKVHPLYIGLTWNEENRFGGGCGSWSQCGLKEDGKGLLTFLSGRNIAIDFSHASDLLARDILNFIDANNLDFSLLASHSNFRTVHPQKRNLPDDIASEIIQRKGVIGLVLYGKFLGTVENLYRQIEFGFKLGGTSSLAFGADFFCLDDMSHQIKNEGFFFDEMSDASKYPSILQSIEKEVGLTPSQLQAFASQNALEFIKKTRK